MITGDRSFKAGHPRFDLQASVANNLTTLYVSFGSFPRISGESFDVVTTQDPFLRGLFGWYLALRLGARFNVQVHADLDSQNLLKRLIAQFVLQRADSVRVVSDKLKQQVTQRSVHVPIHVLPIFVELERFGNIVRNPDARPTILWVGRFEHEKNPLNALHILKEVRKQGVDAKLIMLGAGSLEHILRGHAKDLPVEFPGWQDPVPYLTKAHVVLSTSRTESWGASIVEALAAHIPVISPDVGIAREAGAMVVSRDKLANAVVTVLTSDVHSKLKLKFLSKEAWAEEWLKTLS